MCSISSLQNILNPLLLKVISLSIIYHNDYSQMAKGLEVNVKQSGVTLT